MHSRTTSEIIESLWATPKGKTKPSSGLLPPSPRKDSHAFFVARDPMREELDLDDDIDIQDSSDFEGEVSVCPDIATKNEDSLNFAFESMAMIQKVYYYLS